VLRQELFLGTKLSPPRLQRRVLLRPALIARLREAMITGSRSCRPAFRPAQAHDDNGQATAPDHLKPKLSIVREIISTEDLEND
jgi:hypothetical protein